MNTPKVKGHWWIKVYGPDGNLKASKDGDNVVTTVGQEFLASFLQSAAAAASTFTCKYVAVGTDSTAEAASNTALGSELTRHTGTVSYLSGAIFQVTATFPTGTVNGSVAEYGLFSSSSAGTLFARDTESTIAVGASDNIIVVAQMTIS